jgi:uncharacterized protein (TIGR03435 family)
MKKLITITLALFLFIGSKISYTAAQTGASPQASDSIAKQMASDADPSFEVATIKPTNPDHPASALPLGHHLVFPGTSVRFLLAFVYDVHDKQIIAAPDWIASEKYDFEGVADAPGTPNLEQIQRMFQKLLADRLQLRFHHEKREMSTYILTVAKSGPKLTLSSEDPNGYHSLLGLPQRGMKGHNLSMADFAARLQSGIIDRPVVDQTNLQGTFDFQLTWTPDETQFNQVGARIPPPANTADAPPGLFTAIQEQLGLKLSPATALVDVLVIDHIEKPSEN